MRPPNVPPHAGITSKRSSILIAFSIVIQTESTGKPLLLVFVVQIVGSYVPVTSSPP
jgi:hypothetical protein